MGGRWGPGEGGVALGGERRWCRGGGRGRAGAVRGVGGAALEWDAGSAGTRLQPAAGVKAERSP